MEQPEQPAARSGASPFHVGVLAVVGVGLIGGSLAAALRARGAAGKILGVGRDPRSLARAKRLGLIDDAVTLTQAAQQADLIVLATPVVAIEAILAQLQPLLRDDTLVTDVGSTKANIAAAARAALGPKRGLFVSGHPIAGAETTGPGAANADLFDGRTVVLAPVGENDAQALRYLTRMWQACGARVVTMDAQAHDAALASVSHLPHFLSAAFMAQVAGASDADLRLSLAGSGFRDFTRIAAGSPEVWRDIFLANRGALLAELDAFRGSLDELEHILQRADGPALSEFLERAALARRFWGGRHKS
jgi:prephenate dehydrogenase